MCIGWIVLGTDGCVGMEGFRGCGWGEGGGLVAFECLVAGLTSRLTLLEQLHPYSPTCATHWVGSTASVAPKQAYKADGNGLKRT